MATLVTKNIEKEFEESAGDQEKSIEKINHEERMRAVDIKNAPLQIKRADYFTLAHLNTLQRALSNQCSETDHKKVITRYFC